MPTRLKQLADRLAIWLVVAMIVFKSGICQCGCIQHTLLFEAMHNVGTVDHTERCHGHSHGDHVHVHFHVEPTNDVAEVSETHCFTIADNVDLWSSGDNRSKSVTEFQLQSIAAIQLTKASSATVSHAEIRWRTIDESILRSIGARAALQVYQL